MDGKHQWKEVYGEKQEKKKKKKNKVEEFQLAKPASLGSLASNDQLSTDVTVVQFNQTGL